MKDLAMRDYQGQVHEDETVGNEDEMVAIEDVDEDERWIQNGDEADKLAAK